MMRGLAAVLSLLLCFSPLCARAEAAPMDGYYDLREIVSADEGETAVYMAVVKEYTGYMLFFFENGKVAKVDISAYATKTNRKKLIKAYSDRSPVCAMRYITADQEFVLTSSAGRVLLFHSGAVTSKTTKDTQGVNVMTLKKGHVLSKVEDYKEGRFIKPSRYRTKTLPSAGATLAADDAAEQMKLES